MGSLGFGRRALCERIPTGATLLDVVRIVAGELHQAANGEKRIGALRHTVRECRAALCVAIAVSPDS